MNSVSIDETPLFPSKLELKSWSVLLIQLSRGLGSLSSSINQQIPCSFGFCLYNALSPLPGCLSPAWMQSQRALPLSIRVLHWNLLATDMAAFSGGSVSHSNPGMGPVDRGRREHDPAWRLIEIFPWSPSGGLQSARWNVGFGAQTFLPMGSSPTDEVEE